MKVIDCEQYSLDWWMARRGVPTASDFDKIITPAKGELSKSLMPYACQLIADTYDRFYPRLEGAISGAMQRGTELEPDARRWYEFEQDCEVEQVGFCLTDDGRFGCSPDALVNNRDGGAEIKCPLPHTHVQYLVDGGLPQKYKPQVHGSLVVTGCAWWDFVSYAPGLPTLIVRVEPDSYTDKIRAALELFHEQYQQTMADLDLQEPPEVARDEIELPAMLSA